MSDQPYRIICTNTESFDDETSRLRGFFIPLGNPIVTSIMQICGGTNNSKRSITIQSFLNRQFVANQNPNTRVKRRRN
jgi:hypothetical protein